MKLFGWVSAGVMLFNMVLICCDVFMRYAFNSPIQGTTEIVTMLMAWVAYAGMGYTLLKGQHMQLGAVYDRLHGRIKHIFSFVTLPVVRLPYPDSILGSQILYVPLFHAKIEGSVFIIYKCAKSTVLQIHIHIVLSARFSNAGAIYL